MNCASIVILSITVVLFIWALLFRIRLARRKKSCGNSGCKDCSLKNFCSSCRK